MQETVDFLIKIIKDVTFTYTPHPRQIMCTYDLNDWKKSEMRMGEHVSDHTQATWWFRQGTKVTYTRPGTDEGVPGSLKLVFNPPPPGSYDKSKFEICTELCDDIAHGWFHGHCEFRIGGVVSLKNAFMERSGIAPDHKFGVISDYTRVADVDARGNTYTHSYTIQIYGLKTGKRHSDDLADYEVIHTYTDVPRGSFQFQLKWLNDGIRHFLFPRVLSPFYFPIANFTDSPGWDSMQ